MNEDSLEEAREKFFSFLLKKPCTRKHAEEFLSRRDVPEDHRASMLADAEAMGLVDDLAYARLFVDGHLSWGNAKIIYELESRGIELEDITTALDESEDESSRACEVAKDWRTLGLDGRKIINRLMSRGFSLKAARSALQD